MTAATEARRVLGERFAPRVSTSTAVLDAEIAQPEAVVDATRLPAALRAAHARRVIKWRSPGGVQQGAQPVDEVLALPALTHGQVGRREGAVVTIASVACREEPIEVAVDQAVDLGLDDLAEPAGGLAVVFVLLPPPFGRYGSAIGNQEGATYLSGVNPRAVLIACFGISGMCSALAGVLLAGYSTKAYQAMGDPYLLPAIAAVVLGGTHILGGRGTYLGTIAGVILISLLQSILSVMQMPEAGRQVIYGVVIVVMLLVYGRGEKVQA